MQSTCLHRSFANLSLSARPKQVSRVVSSAQSPRLASSCNGIVGSSELRCSTSSEAKPSLRLAAQPVCHVKRHAAKRPKLKTKKAAAKRYKITGTGKVLTRKPGKQHMNQKMSRQHKRKLSSLRGVEKADFNNVASLLPGQKLRK
ncbi:hypothetical protein WJX74_002475 [Apatococcus lobatus]|uniref:50S ribosomal protein L35 n=1 Tax=Apatococcus lobatus TaxID=904363 RepID=A0AAW1RL87_9CHLO